MEIKNKQNSAPTGSGQGALGGLGSEKHESSHGVCNCNRQGFMSNLSSLCSILEIEVKKFKYFEIMFWFLSFSSAMIHSEIRPYGFITITQVKNMDEIYYKVWGENLGMPIAVVA